MSDRKAPSAPKIIREVAGLRAMVRGWREKGERVALVPTMGALHEGHLALVRRAQEEAERVVVSLFVNRPQFNSQADFASYPRDEAADAALLARAPVALIYAPSAATMYPEGFATAITVRGPADDLEGAHRPGHFAGVATVVAKLFAQCAPDTALFGEKDYQQLLVVRRLVTDLDLPVRIVGVPTVREADGLACSSRNRLLSKDERAIAPALYRALTALVAEAESGADLGEACAKATRALLAAGFARVDYVAVRDAETLAPVARLAAPARALAAALLGRTRLIDNLPIAPRAPAP
jgi:pantoate--beta-alanine ligase